MNREARSLCDFEPDDCSSKQLIEINLSVCFVTTDSLFGYELALLQVLQGLVLNFIQVQRLNLHQKTLDLVFNRRNLSLHAGPILSLLIDLDPTVCHGLAKAYLSRFRRKLCLI